MNKKVFITGATGFIGSHIARKLAYNKKYTIHIIKRDESNIFRINDILDKVTIHTGDITDSKRLAKIINIVKPDIIFHLASIGVYGGMESKPQDIISANLIGTMNLLQASENIEYECFVNTGSSSEYGNRNSIMAEKDRCEPQGVYGVSKLASTVYSQDYARKHKKPILNLRIFTPYGGYDNSSRLIPYIITSVLKGNNISLAKKDTVRDFVYIEDVVDAYIQSIRYAKRTSGEVINIGTGKERSVYDVVQSIIKISKTNPSISWNTPVSRFESKVWKASNKKAKNLLHWSPKYTFEEGLIKTYLWYKDCSN